MGNKKDLHFRLNDWLNLQIEELSNARKQSKSTVIRAILTDWVENNLERLDAFYNDIKKKEDSNEGSI